ncbi:hypothetical protein HZA99_03895 [Candidatus Woesearchaeota archaeon]|nr:hypothetical protein [Candidatus Woesearchaeota archaeon]
MTARKCASIVFLLLLFTSLVQASAPQTAGVSPDNPIFWRIEIFFEDINVAVTSDPAVKVQKSLDHAEERVAEVEKMLRWNKTDAAEKALNKYDTILEKTQTVITTIDDDDKQQALKRELEINASLATYISHLVELQALIASTSHDATQTALLAKISERMTTTTASLEQVLADKKQQTETAVKANGVTDDVLLQMEQDIQEGIGQTKNVEDQLDSLQKMNLTSFVDTAADIASNDSLMTSLAANATSLAEQAVDAAAEFLEENQSSSSSQQTHATATISDASSRNKLKVDGAITADQQQKINILYQQLQTENTEAEIEIAVSQTDSGYWKIEKEIDGTLSAQQTAQLTDLLLSFSNPTNAVSIKIKYTPVSAPSKSTIVYSGTSDSGVSTNFQIG